MTPGLITVGGAQVTALHNGSARPIVVAISAPRASLDCRVLAASPAMISPLLESVEWTEPKRIVLRPNQLADPLYVPQTDDTLGEAYGDDSCAVRRIEVEGAGTRWIVADREVLPGRAFPEHATLSELGEGVVSILPQSVHPFRATSPDLLFAPEAPLETCPTEDSGTPMSIDVDGLVGTFQGVLESVQTTEEAGRNCIDVVVALLVAEGDVPPQMSARVCADGSLPALPFTVGESPVGFRWRSNEHGDRIELTGATASWTATTTMTLEPYSVRFEPPDWAEPICLDATEPLCPTLNVDRHALSMQRLDDWRETLSPVFPASIARFEIPTGTDGSVEHVAVWLDDAPTGVSTAAECRPRSVEMVFVRSLSEP